MADKCYGADMDLYTALCQTTPPTVTITAFQ